MSKLGRPGQCQHILREPEPGRPALICKERAIIGGDYCERHIPGCPYKKQKFEWACGKIPETGSMYCAKHILILEDEAMEGKRRAETRRLIQEANKAKEEELANSPLAALNPLFDVHREDVG